MIPFRLYAYAIGIAALTAAGLIAYQWIHRDGIDEGYGMCVAEYQPRIDRMQSEALAAQQAVLKAIRDRDAATKELNRQMEEKSNEYTRQIESLEAGNAGVRRELGRLRDALATARTSLRALSKPDPAPARPEADAAPADTGQLLGACAERLVEVGGFADRLAAQVVGLQAYARLAHKACGS